MGSKKRFEVLYSQGTLECYRVLVDKETGVNYLMIVSGGASGITPLLGQDGKPVISPKEI